MKYLLGLFLLSHCLETYAGNILLLRGRVPASYNVSLDTKQKPYLATNTDSKGELPKLTTTTSKNTVLVTVIHP